MDTQTRRSRTTIRSSIFALACTVLATLVAVVLGHAPAAGARADAADLPAIEHARLKALVDADTATAGQLMASDFEVVNPGGFTIGRDDYLGAVDAGFIDYLVFEPTAPIDVRRSGDAAVLRFPVNFDLVVGGTRVTHGGWITELYELRRGAWQIVWEQATAVPNDFDLFLESIKPPA